MKHIIFDDDGDVIGYVSTSDKLEDVMAKMTYVRGGDIDSEEISCLDDYKIPKQLYVIAKTYAHINNDGTEDPWSSTLSLYDDPPKAARESCKSNKILKIQTNPFNLTYYTYFTIDTKENESHEELVERYEKKFKEIFETRKNSLNVI